MHSYTQTCPIHPRTLRVDRLRPGTARWLCRPQMIVPMQCHAGMPVKCPQVRWQGCGPGPRSARLPGGSPVSPPPGRPRHRSRLQEGHQHRYKKSRAVRKKQRLSTSTHREASIAGLRTEIRHEERGNPHTCHAMPHPSYPIPAGDGISLLRVPLDCKSYQNTLTESLRRSIRRNRSMPRARIFPNGIVGSDAPASFGALRLGA